MPRPRRLVRPPRHHNKPTHWDYQAEIELLRHFCRVDFWTFFLYAFGAGLNPRARRWVKYELHYPIAQWFQEHVDQWFHWRRNGVGRKKNLAILVHRRIGKTTQITRAGQLWLHVRDPESATATGSENLILSGKMLDAMKAVIDGSDPHALFTKLFGNWATDARSWTGKQVVHVARRNTSRQDPSLSTFAVETSIVGSHPDAVFYDDPISYEAIQKDTGWISTVVDQASSLFPALESDALIVWIGTRYSSMDHFGSTMVDEGVADVTGMARESGFDINPDGIWHVYFLAGRDMDGKPTTPHIWPEGEMKRYEKLKPLRFAAQVLNNPQESETNPITADQIKQCVVKKDEVPWGMLSYAITCDTAFATGAKQVGKDETVMIVHGYPRDGSGLVYVIEGYGSKTWRAEDFAKLLVSTVQRYRRQGKRITAITDERETSKHGSWKIALQNYFADSNEPMPAFHQFDRWKMQSKRDRIHGATMFWVDGRVKIIENAPGSRELMAQLSQVGEIMSNPKMKNDWVDAHADAFEYPIYQPARRLPNQRAPWEKGSTLVEMEGFDRRMFEDDDFRSWQNANPREPLK